MTVCCLVHYSEQVDTESSDLYANSISPRSDTRSGFSALGLLFIYETSYISHGAKSAVIQHNDWIMRVYQYNNAIMTYMSPGNTKGHLMLTEQIIVHQKNSYTLQRGYYL